MAGHRGVRGKRELADAFGFPVGAPADPGDRARWAAVDPAAATADNPLGIRPGRLAVRPGGRDAPRGAAPMELQQGPRNTAMLGTHDPSHGAPMRAAPLHAPSHGAPARAPPRDNPMAGTALAAPRAAGAPRYSDEGEAEGAGHAGRAADAGRAVASRQERRLRGGPVDTPDGPAQPASGAPAPGDHKSLVLEALRTRPNADSLSLRQATGLTKSEVNSALYKLKDEKKVVMKADNEHKLWSLPVERSAVDDLTDFCARHPGITITKGTPHHAQLAYVFEYQYSVMRQPRCVCGPPDRLPEQAQILAAVEVLGALTEDPELDAVIREEAVSLFGARLAGASALRFGKQLDVLESSEMEFKGGKDSDRPWPHTRFFQSFRREVGEAVCGFINRSVLRGIGAASREPLKASEIVFGVHDSGVVTGISIVARPAEYARVRAAFIDEARKLFDDLFSHLKPGPTFYKIDLSIDSVSTAGLKTPQPVLLFLVRVIVPMACYRTPAMYNKVMYVRGEASTRVVQPGSREHGLLTALLSKSLELDALMDAEDDADASD
eukprot:m.58247 g.58247  ORF g.58247 m.58247 type:complete len:551 (-) comp6883_c0_seq1:161-1813(-)